MPSLHRDPTGRSPYWYCAFTNADGKRSFKSTKQKKFKDAEVICREWDDAARKGREKVLTEVQVRKVLGDIYERTNGEKIEFETIASYFKRWLEAKKENTSKSTQRIYGDAVAAFLSHLGNKAELNLLSLDKRHFVSFRDALRDEGKANKTINLAMGSLRSALNDARRDQKVLSNPAEALQPLPENSGERQRFTRGQLGDILKAADAEWKGATLLGAHHAMRLGDAANLKRSNVDFLQKTISFVPQKQKRTATPKKIVVPMHTEVERCLLALPIQDRNPDAPLFPSLAGKPVEGGSGLSHKFVLLMEKAGIVRQAVSGKTKGTGRQVFDLGFHSLRHTAISEQADAGMPEDMRKKVSGHASDRVHAGYTKHGIEAVRKEIEKVPSFLPE